MLKYIITLMLMVIFTGCLGTERIIQTKIVYIDKKILLTPPQHLLKPVVVPTPPESEEFIHTDNVTRINMMSNYIIDLLKALGNSNDKIKSIEDWSSSLDKVYNKKEK